METSATLIPSIHCENCKVRNSNSSSPKDGPGYDPELSDTETLIGCSADYCDKSTITSPSSRRDMKKYCPMNHSPNGQCCSRYEKDYCGWDSRINTFASTYYAEGRIVRDEFPFKANGFTGYFVNVL